MEISKKLEDRKGIIAEAAKKLFSEKGYSATGLRDIAKNAGVSLGNVYNHFKNKEEIFKFIFRTENVVDALGEILPYVNDDFPYNLKEIIIKVRNIVDDNIDLFKLIFIDLIEFNGKYSNKAMDAMIKVSQAVVSEKIKKGEIKDKFKDMDLMFLTKSFITIVIPLFITTNILPAADSKDEYKNEELAELLAKTLLFGIKE